MKACPGMTRRVFRDAVGAYVICGTGTRSHGSGTNFTYCFVRSRRTHAKVRQQALLNRHTHFPIQRERWQALSSRSGPR